jgi:hypothetical protein
MIDRDDKNALRDWYWKHIKAPFMRALFTFMALIGRDNFKHATREDKQCKD